MTAANDRSEARAEMLKEIGALQRGHPQDDAVFGSSADEESSTATSSSSMDLMEKGLTNRGLHDSALTFPAGESDSSICTSKSSLSTASSSSRPECDQRCSCSEKHEKTLPLHPPSQSSIIVQTEFQPFIPEPSHLGQASCATAETDQTTQISTNGPITLLDMPPLERNQELPIAPGIESATQQQHTPVSRNQSQPGAFHIEGIGLQNDLELGLFSPRPPDMMPPEHVETLIEADLVKEPDLVEAEEFTLPMASPQKTKYRVCGGILILSLVAAFAGTLGAVLSRSSSQGNTLLPIADHRSFAERLQYGNTIIGSAPNDRLGTPSAISASGTTLALGTQNNGRLGWTTGAVRVFRAEEAVNIKPDAVGSENLDDYKAIEWWQVGNPIMGEQASDRFGAKDLAMTADGNRVAIGAYNHSVLSGGHPNGTLQSAGYVRVYELIKDTWTPVGPKIEGHYAGEQLGTALDLSSEGRVLAVGGDSPGGQVRVYQETDSNGTVAWEQMGSPLLARTEYDLFGQEVKLSANGLRVAVGASKKEGEDVKQGNGYVRVYDFDGTDWRQAGQDLEGDSNNCRFGRKIAMSTDGSVLAVAARNSDDSQRQKDAGSVRIYRYDTIRNTFLQMGETLWGTGVSDKFGDSVALSGDGLQVVVGASQKKTDTGFGYVRIFDFDEGNNEWMQVGADLKGQDMTGAKEFDRFGTSVALASNGGLLAVGSDGGDKNGYNSGHVQVFDVDKLRLNKL